MPRPPEETENVVAETKQEPEGLSPVDQAAEGVAGARPIGAAEVPFFQRAQVLVPIIVAVIGALGVLLAPVVKQWAEDHWHTAETSRARNEVSTAALETVGEPGYDRGAWVPILFFDREALEGLASWVKASGTSEGLGPDFHFIRGRAFHQLGRFAEAAAEYRQAEGMPYAKYFHALALMSLNQPNDALPLLDAFLKGNPNDVAAQYYRGVCLLHRHDYRAGMTCFQSIVARRPEAIGAWHNLGVCALHLREYRVALDAFTRVTSNNPTFSRALFNQGVALFNLGRKEDALAAISKSVSFDRRRVAQLENEEHSAMLTDPLIGASMREIANRQYGN